MKNSVAIYLLLIIAASLTSWLCSIYTDADIRNMLSAEGVAWLLDNIVTNIHRSPLVLLLFFSITASLVHESRVWEIFRRTTWRRPRSLAKMRAVSIVGIYLLLTAVVIVVTCILPASWTVSPLGHFTASPLMHALFPIVLAWTSLLSIVYALASSRFAGSDDVMKAALKLPRRLGAYFITHLFSAQLFNMCYYILCSSEGSSVPLDVALYVLCFIVPYLCFFFSETVINNRKST